jgi:hypothetical protein
MTNATGAPAELLQVTGMRRCLKGIRHQQSTPFTSFNDGLPIRVVQRYLGFPGTSRPFRYEGSQGRTSAAEKPCPVAGLESRRGLRLSYASMLHVSYRDELMRMWTDYRAKEDSDD